MKQRFSDNINIKNRQASFEFELLDKYVAGMVLMGTEIKSIREGKVNLQDGYCYINNGELFVKGINITPYAQGTHYNHAATRERKLLLKRSEIKKLEGKIEETLNIGKWATVGFTGFYYWIHTYNGLPGNSLVGILKPTVSIKLFKNLSIGMEHHIYHNDRFLNEEPNLHLTRTEQKLFLQLYFQGRQRNDKYH